MPGTHLNDVVTDWAIDAGWGNEYNLGKTALLSGYEIADVASWGGAESWNEGVYNLATNQPQGTLDNLVSEAGDQFITESTVYTNYIVLES